MRDLIKITSLLQKNKNPWLNYVFVLCLQFKKCTIISFLSGKYQILYVDILNAPSDSFHVACDTFADLLYYYDGSNQ